jgi:putative FmdB family regulatory protein
MPIYEYRCEGCEHRFETLVRGAETPVCPTCGSQALARELSTFAVSTGGGSTAYRAASPSPCGSCGDPRGPGSCAMN